MATDPALCATATLATLPLSLTVATSAPSLIVMDVLSQMDDYLFIEDPFKSLFDHLTSVVLSEIRATAPQGHARVYRSHLQQRTLQYAIDTRYAVDQIQALREDCPVSIRIIVLDNVSCPKDSKDAHLPLPLDRSTSMRLTEFTFIETTRADQALYAIYLAIGNDAQGDLGPQVL